MGAKSKSGEIRSAARKRAAKPARRQARRAATVPDYWEQSVEFPDERDDEIDCQRIVQGDGGRRLPADFDDYN